MIELRWFETEKPSRATTERVRASVGKCVKIRTNRGKEYTVQIVGIRLNKNGNEFLDLRNPVTGGDVAIKPFLNTILHIEEVDVADNLPA